MKVSSVRLGFASNSSSTHYIISLPSKKHLFQLGTKYYEELQNLIELLENRESMDIDEISEKFYDATWTVKGTIESITGWGAGYDN